MKFVSIILASKSDFEVMSECAKTLDKFGVLHELVISSAHRSPNRTYDYVKNAEEQGARVFIAAAGMAAHLAGVVSSLTIKPVIGVPMEGGALDGMDALLSTVQMPVGLPVATMSMGQAGAVNAAYLAMQILAQEDNELRVKLEEDRILKAKKVEVDSLEVEIKL